MKPSITCIGAALLGIILLSACSTPNPETDNVFYAFSNAGNLPGMPEDLESQVALFSELGFEGWGGHYRENDNPGRRAALEKAGLRMPEAYWDLLVDSTGAWTHTDGLKECIADARDRNLLISLVVTAPAFQDDHNAGDPLVAGAVRELADYAAPFGVNVAVYPHHNNYCETVEHSVRLARLAKRDNVGAIFNLCHFLKVEGEHGWAQKLAYALPYLFMISLSGADGGQTKDMGWDQLIQPLGEGSYDTYPLVKMAWDLGYEGPFGLQTYNIRQDAREALATSMATWRSYQERYARDEALEYPSLFD